VPKSLTLTVSSSSSSSSGTTPSTIQTTKSLRRAARARGGRRRFSSPLSLCYMVSSLLSLRESLRQRRLRSWESGPTPSASWPLFSPRCNTYPRSG
jgi:hypothetical protein